MKVVLLAAGFGSRLWPLSTSGKPKQFQTLLGEQSLLQHTYKLFSEIASPLDIYVLTLQGLEHWVYQQIPGMDPNKILLVPERRNTFPHTLFALRSITASPDEPVLFTGTDIYMSDAKDFIKTVKTAMRKRGKQRTSKDTILFCSSAERPDTNAGYITLHKDRVTKHLEKPDLETIQKLSREAPLYKTMFTYITSQHSLKQSLASADRHIAALAKELLDAEAPDIAAALLAMPLCDISNTVFANARNLTAAVTSCDFMDMGSFMALYRINKKDKNGNVVFGKAILDGDCTNNFIANHTGQPLIVIDSKDMAIVQTPWGNLISPIAESKRVGEIYKKKLHPNEPKNTPTPSQQG